MVKLSMDSEKKLSIFYDSRDITCIVISNKIKRSYIIYTQCVTQVTRTRMHVKYIDSMWHIKETRSVTMNIFRKIYFLFKTFLKIELSYVFTIIMFSTAENCMKK